MLLFFCFFFWEVMKWVCLVFSRFKTSGCHFFLISKYVCSLMTYFISTSMAQNSSFQKFRINLLRMFCCKRLLLKFIIWNKPFKKGLPSKHQVTFFFFWNKESLNNFYINVSPECCCFKYPPKYYRNKPNLFFFWHAKGRKQKRFV